MRLYEIEDISGLLEKYKDEVNFALDRYNTEGVAIYRGSKTYNKQIMFIDLTTRTTDRKSANTYNYYTLWMSNNPQWADYPKRNRSLICSTDSRKAKIYGKTMIVIPLVDCKIGICPSDDIWFSTHPSLSRLTDWLSKHLLERWPTLHDKELTYDVFIQKLKEITSNGDSYYELELEKLLKKYGNAEDVMNEMLNPNKNGFTISTWKNFNTKENREVWLSAPCLLISPIIFMRLLQDRKNATI